jgi:hypothetical protein
MIGPIEFVKEHPWKITLGTIITLAVTVGSFYFTDMRYAKKADMEAYKVEVQKTLDEMKSHLPE